MFGKFFHFFFGAGRKDWDLTIHESRSFPSGETEALIRGAPLRLEAWKVFSADEGAKRRVEKWYPRCRR